MRNCSGLILPALDEAGQGRTGFDVCSMLRDTASRLRYAFMREQTFEHLFKKLAAVAAGAVHHGVHGRILDVGTFAVEAVMLESVEFAQQVGQVIWAPALHIGRQLAELLQEGVGVTPRCG